MDYRRAETIEKDGFRIKNILSHAGIDRIRLEIEEGLKDHPPHLSSKFFYDDQGSRLFEQITSLEEYYPTRTEVSILERIAPEFMDHESNVEIVELGSGDPTKISILLDAAPASNIENILYVPVDVSQGAVEDSARILGERFPGISIDGLVCDFTKQMDRIPDGKRRLFCFFGSTIGNFKEEEAVALLKNLSEAMHPGEELLMGMDMLKSQEILVPAYDDAKGVTASFNRNILNVIGNLLETHINPELFEHIALFNERHSRMEMHLEAKEDLSVDSPFFSGPVSFSAGDRIHTESSHKYTVDKIQHFAREAGLAIQDRFTDAREYFSVVHLQKAG